MRRYAGLFALLFASACVSCKKEPIDPPPPLVWHDLAGGEKLARTRDMPALLFFGASWSKADMELEQETFPSVEVREALRGWVAIQIDVTDDEDKESNDARRRFAMVGDPLTILIDFGSKKPDGDELARFNEYVKPATMAAAIREAGATIARRRAARH